MGAMKKGAKNPPYSKILVIEREGIIAMDLERILRSFGCADTVLAFSVEEAQAKLNKESPDLIFIDRSLEDGPHGRRRGRKIVNRSRIPVIFIGVMPETKVKNLSRMEGYLKMPFNEKDIHTAIERIRRRK